MKVRDLKVVLLALLLVTLLGLIVTHQAKAEGPRIVEITLNVLLLLPTRSP